MYSFVVIILTAVTKIFNLLKVEGKERLQTQEKPYVIACTHKGWLEVIMLAVILYPTPIYFMAKKELYNNKIIAQLLHKLNAFPVNRENPGPSVLKIPLKLLKDNKVVGIFPSGTRKEEGASLKRGAATIAQKAGVVIIPAIYEGPVKIKEYFRGEKSRIAIGEPLESNKTFTDRTAQIEDLLIRLEKSMEEIKNNQ